MRAAAGLAAAMQAGRLFAGDGAATQGELVVHYQPVFQTGSQQITAVDVFVRSERAGALGPSTLMIDPEMAATNLHRVIANFVSVLLWRFRNRVFIAGLPRSVLEGLAGYAPGIAPRELQRSTTPAGRAKTSPIFQNQPEVNAPFTSTTMSVARKV
jgi:hypothetical protein